MINYPKCTKCNSVTEYQFSFTEPYVQCSNPGCNAKYKHTVVRSKEIFGGYDALIVNEIKDHNNSDVVNVEFK